jgi:tetratricopeptide (TPR) repeat protein
MISLRTLLVTSIVSLSATSATAKPSLYDQASQNYEKQNFAAARDQFLKVVKSEPKSFKAQFQLANCYAQLKDFKKARATYATCLTCKPDKDTATLAQNAVQYLDAYMARAAQPQAPPSWQRPSAWGTSGTHSSPDSSSNSEPDQVKFLRAHKSEIMAQGEREAKAVTDQSEKDIEDLKENGMYRYRDPDTGYRTRGAPPYMIEQIKKEAKEKANEIRKEAKRRADAIRIPGED